MQTLLLIAPVFAVMVTGFVSVRLGIVPRNIAGYLIGFVYHVALPALMFRIVAEAPLASLLNGPFWLAYGGGTLVLLAVVRVAAAPLLGDTSVERTLNALGAAATNTGFVALPILHSLFGAKGVPPAAISNLFMAAVFFPVGLAMLSLSDRAAGLPSASRFAREVLLSPLVWPTLLGVVFAVTDLSVAKIADDYLAILSAALTPCALFAVGASLDLGAIAQDRLRLTLITVLKLIALPALVLGIGVASDMPGFVVITAVICACVPTAKTVYFLAEEHHAGEKTAAAVISTTTLFSVVTITGWIVLLHQLYPEGFSRAGG